MLTTSLSGVLGKLMQLQLIGGTRFFRWLDSNSDPGL